MTIELITAWYNEEFLAPFFLNHYSWVDKITILFDEATKDNTLGAIKNFCRNKKTPGPSVPLHPINYRDGMDDRDKIRAINQLYMQSKCDYVMVADADEFIVADRATIESGFDLTRVKFYNVYRHESDVDLDPDKPAFSQRTHGHYVWPYTKPCIARAGLNMAWGMGCHMLKLNGKREGNIKISLDSQTHYNPVILKGAHWINADPCFCIKRRLGTMARQSERNKLHGLSRHNHNLSEVKIVNDLLKHKTDPVVI